MNAKVFMATIWHNGIARAECDSSGNWSVENLLSGTDVRCLAPDPHDPSVVYAGMQGGGVLKSNDRGKTWQEAGLKGHIIKSIAVSRAEPGVVYAGCKPPMLFVSRDSAQTWQELESFRRVRQWWWFTPAEKPIDPYVMAVAPSPTDPNIILAGMELGAVVRSDDGGLTWSKHRKGAIRDCHSMRFHTSDGNWVYQGGGYGAAVSSDGGLTWTNNKKGMVHRYGFPCAADPANPEIWYTATAPGPNKAHSSDRDAEAHIYRAEGTGNWTRLEGGLPNPLKGMPYALLTDPAAPGHLYAGLSTGEVWFSEDHGDTWRQLDVALGDFFYAMVMLT